jgi:hypothetical protein
MRGSEFKRKVEKLGKTGKLAVTWEPSHGKGSHGRLGLGEKFTTLKDLKKEIGKGLLSDMCKQLGITPEDLNNA